MHTKNHIQPLPEGKGVGFMSMQPLPPEIVADYRFEQVGRFYNYHFTNKNWRWPVDQSNLPESKVIDAFSPNLNKHLHVGHLRNLSLAKSLSSLLPNSRFVAMLGHSLGVKEDAKNSLMEWFRFTGYQPEVFADTDLKADESQFVDGTGEYQGCKIFNGVNGPVVVIRSDGSHTYAYHDLAFAQLVGPNYYLTGNEQKEHFSNLGLGDRHLAMGLVLDPNTGKKMKSRDGTALSASDALQLVIDCLNPTPHPKELAWNVLAWNFLHVKRSADLKFNVQEWTKAESPGMYISYTYARVHSALEKAGYLDIEPIIETDFTLDDLTASDVKLLGYSTYFDYWQNRAAISLDSAALANYAHDLARYLGTIYHGEAVKGGRKAYIYSVGRAFDALSDSMQALGMIPLESV